MKVDQDYLRQILDVFIDSPRSFVWPADLLAVEGVELDDRFLFHMQVLEDQGFVECLDRNRGLGYEIQMGGEFSWHSHPLRLTAAGHAFAEAIRRAEIWEVLKAEFRDSSLETLSAVARKLLEGLIRKQLGKYLDL